MMKIITSDRVAFGVNLLLLLGLIGWSIVVWDSLPERIPVHFSLGGKVDRWEEKSLIAWFALPMIAVALSLLLHGIVWFVRRHPDSINVPDKQKYLALPIERKQEVIAAIASLLHWVGAVVTLMFLLIQAGSYRVALGEAESPLVLIGALIGIVTMPFVGVVAIVRTQGIIDRR